MMLLRTLNKQRFDLIRICVCTNRLVIFIFGQFFLLCLFVCDHFYNSEDAIRLDMYDFDDQSFKVAIILLQQFTRCQLFKLKLLLYVFKDV